MALSVLNFGGIPTALNMMQWKLFGFCKASDILDNAHYKNTNYDFIIDETYRTPLLIDFLPLQDGGNDSERDSSTTPVWISPQHRHAPWGLYRSGMPHIQYLAIIMKTLCFFLRKKVICIHTWSHMFYIVTSLFIAFYYTFISLLSFFFCSYFLCSISCSITRIWLWSCCVVESCWSE